MDRPVRVGISARHRDGAHGGVQHIVLGLVQGLRELDDPRVRPVVFVFTGEYDWLKPHLGPDWEIVELPYKRPDPPAPDPERRTLRNRAGRLPGRVTRDLFGSPVPVSRENSRVTKAKVDVVHFPSQSGWRTQTPSIYQPHDLQHEHLRRNFSRWERRNRRFRYGTLAHQAATVVVGTSWVRDDVVRHLHLPADKVAVVPVAAVDLPPANWSRAELVRRPFLLYPAAPWPHKNHRRLLEAVALLRTKGLEVPTVLPGSQVGDVDSLRGLVGRLHLEDLVTLPGFVDDGTLALLYEHARLVCVPTLFESASFPIWEAFRHGCPVVASNVTSLPKQVGNAGLLVNPRSTRQIAEAVATVWQDENLRADLVGKGAERAKLVSLARTAQMFVAHYLRLAGRSLSREDEELLCEPPPL